MSLKCSKWLSTCGFIFAMLFIPFFHFLYERSGILILCIYLYGFILI